MGGGAPRVALLCLLSTSLHMLPRLRQEARIHNRKKIPRFVLSRRPEQWGARIAPHSSDQRETVAQPLPYRLAHPSSTLAQFDLIMFPGSSESRLTHTYATLADKRSQRMPDFCCCISKVDVQLRMYVPKLGCGAICEGAEPRNNMSRAARI